MTGEVVNLRLARKRKKRLETERRAAENRASHGQTKHEKRLLKAREEKSLNDWQAGHREPTAKSRNSPHTQ